MNINNMLITLFLLLFSIVIALKASLAADTFNTVFIKHSCAPWDGPAITIILAKKGSKCDKFVFPYLGLNFWKDLPEQIGNKNHKTKEYEFVDTASNGSVIYCESQDICKIAKKANIIFTKFSKNGEVSGEYDIQLKDEKLKGTFKTTKWCENREFCR